MSRKVDVVILGAGSAGLSALSQVRRAGKSFVLINGGEEGTTCARVGCMPSKALIEAANAYHARTRFSALGLRGTDSVTVDGSAVLARVRDIRDKLVKGVVGGYRKTLDDDQFIRGYARLLGPNRVEINGEQIDADAIIIATGSSPVLPDPFKDLGEALLTTDNLFEQTALPRSLAVVGLGAIGCEIGQAMARLGVSVYGFDAASTIAGCRDPEAASVARELVGADMRVFTDVSVSPSLEDGRVLVRTADKQYTVDRLLASLGRRPSIQGLGLESLGVPLDEHGLPDVDPNTLQVGSLPVFVTGDANADKAILHEAADEGRIAGINAVAETNTAFVRRVPLSVAFTSPQIVSVGQSWDALDHDSVAIGSYQPTKHGRAMIKGENQGMLRIYADRKSARLLGATLVMAEAEHLGHWLALAIDRGLSIPECLAQTFYHPVMEEALREALQACLSECEVSSNYPPGLRPCDSEAGR